MAMEERQQNTQTEKGENYHYKKNIKTIQPQILSSCVCVYVCVCFLNPLGNTV